MENTFYFIKKIELVVYAIYPDIFIQIFIYNILLRQCEFVYLYPLSFNNPPSRHRGRVVSGRGPELSVYRSGAELSVGRAIWHSTSGSDCGFW